MPLMNLFEPLFLLLAFLTVLTVLTAAALAAAGRFARAGRILRRLAIGAAVYFAIVIVVTLVSPRRVYRVGDPQCFDDWCITVTTAQPTPGPTGTDWDVTLRLSNRARRTPMGEKDTVVYLTDRAGSRYDALPQPDAVPLDTRLLAGQSMLATRRFHVPAGAEDVGLVFTHEGTFPIGWFIITEGGWFQQPPLVRFD